MDKLQAGKPLAVGNFTLVPIEHFIMHTGKGRTGCWLAAHKEPYAIIICGTHGIRAFNLEAKEVSLEHLAQAIPDLGAILAPIAH
ncbi:MAG: hypothetical protein L0Z73_01765 [Gammaproteobacteria bacterium]|nr:hypothetical protein [Gammaproteobacteria bacterium]